MQVLLAGTTARADAGHSHSSSDWKQNQDKMVLSPNRVLSHFPLGRFTKAGQCCPESQRYCGCRGARQPTTGCSFFFFFFLNKSVARAKKRKCLAPTVHAILPTQGDALPWEGQKQTNGKQKLIFQCITCACVCVYPNFVLHVEGRQALLLFLLPLLL